jgi:uncharacterized protein involved in outer membrane biogenesis
MKKLFIRLLIALVILVILGVIAVGLFLDAGIKRGVETVGPMLTKVTVKLDSVNLSLLSGSGKIKGLVLGNPEGYKTPFAIQVGQASLALKPGSLLSDKIVIKSVDVQAPEITYETNLKQSNLGKIIATLQAGSGGQTEPAAQPNAAKAGKKLQLDDFSISGGKIHISITVMGGKSVTVPLADIHLKDLGQGPDGITAGELTKKVLQAIETQAVQAVSGVVGDAGKAAADLTKGAAKTATDAAGSVTKGIGDLFKSK